MRYTDPSGHGVDCGLGESCVIDPYTSPLNGNSNSSSGEDNDDPGSSRDEIQIILPSNIQISSSVPTTLNDLLPFTGPQACELILQNPTICNADYSGMFDPENPYSIQSLIAVALMVNFNALGARIEFSGHLPVVGGFDINFDSLYFFESKEVGFFITPGKQEGISGGGAMTFGLLFGQNLPNATSYSGPSVSIIGADVPVPHWGVMFESDYSIGMSNPNGSTPSTLYIGTGPLQPEVGGYAVGGITFQVFKFRIP